MTLTIKQIKKEKIKSEKQQEHTHTRKNNKRKLNLLYKQLSKAKQEKEAKYNKRTTNKKRVLQLTDFFFCYKKTQQFFLPLLGEIFVVFRLLV